MRSATAAWCASAAYLYVLHLDDPRLAWEYLRRNREYQRDWHQRPADSRRIAAPWWLRALENPALDARNAQPQWRSDLEDQPRFVARRRYVPGISQTDLWTLRGSKRLFHDGAKVILSRHDPAASAVGLGRRAIFHLRALQALDGFLAGASQREIALVLFGSHCLKALWLPDSALRAQTRRYLRRARAYSSGGYRALAFCIGPSAGAMKSSLPPSSQTEETHCKRRSRAKHPCDATEPPPMATQPTISVPPRYLTAEEAAEFLRLSPRTLEKHRSVGGGPPYRKFGRRVRYMLPDLEAWAESRRFGMTSDPDYPALPPP